MKVTIWLVWVLKIKKDSRRTVGGQSEDKTNKENKEIKSYTRDEVFEREVLTFFGFNEIANHDKAKILYQCCTALNNSDQLKNFKEQFYAYREFKKLTGLHYRHNFIVFLGNQENKFQDGQWNAENWELKLIQEKDKNRKQQKTSTLAPSN